MKSVKIVEVGLRDGLQNEKVNISAQVRIEAAYKMIQAGLLRLEVGAFVRPDRVPQMAGSIEVVSTLVAAQAKGKIASEVGLSALVPNEKGMQDALRSGVQEIAIFASCSETFSQKNINCSIEESFERFAPIVKIAKQKKIKVRGYLSTCFACPFEGPISEKVVLKMAQRLHRMGCFEISIGDTIGVATPNEVISLFKKLKKVLSLKKIAGHFHDTRGTAIANIFAAYSLGITTFDASLGGLGGCPYAPGAAGNVATEDVVYLFDRMKVPTGIDLNSLIELNHWMGKQLGKTLPSKVGQAGLFRPKKG